MREPINKNTIVPTSGGVTRINLGNLLENFKTYILGMIGSQLDTLKIKKKTGRGKPCIKHILPKM
jgi:hypothetical protein